MWSTSATTESPLANTDSCQSGGQRSNWVPPAR
jgi:hypothetical protein